MTINPNTVGSRVLVAFVAIASLSLLGQAPSFAAAPAPTPPVSAQSTLAEVVVTITGTALDHAAVDVSADAKDVPNSNSTATSSIAPTAASAVASAIKCWDFDLTRTGKNLLGDTLFSLTTHTSWCGDGTTIQTRATTTTSHTTAFGWTYESLEQDYNKWGVGYPKFYSMRQAQFCLVNCLAGNSLLTNQPLVGPSGQVYSY